MKVKDQLIKRRSKKKNNNKIIPLKTKKKTNPFVVPDDNQLLTTASVVSIAEAFNKMWEKPVLHILKEEPVKISTDKNISIKKKEAELPFDVDDTANDDNILSQDLNVGLKLWLEAYCGIPNNICYLDISEEAKQVRRKAQENSQRVRKDAGKPLLNVPKWHWKQKHGNTRPRYPVPGWHGLRSPTVVQLLVQAYSKGYSYSIQANRVKVPTTMSIASKTTAVKTTTKCLVEQHDLEYWRYQSTLKNMSYLPSKLSTPVHLTNIVKVNKLFKLKEALRYERWLYNHEALNPIVDVVPFQHRSAETGLYYGDRYEGRKAAEHASHRRHFKRNSVYGDAKWNRYLCYYHGFKNGNLTEGQLEGISKYIWEETDSCDVLVFKDIPGKSEGSFCYGDDQNQLLLPSPAMFNKMYPPPLESNQDESLIVRNIMGSLHPSGHSQDEVYHFVISKGWKKLPNMLIDVPESFQEEGGHVVIPYDSSFDHKQRHLKTG